MKRKFFWGTLLLVALCLLCVATIVLCINRESAESNETDTQQHSEAEALAQESLLQKPLLQKIQVDAIAVENTDNGPCLRATATTPNYSSIFSSCEDEIDAGNQTEFAKELYQLAEKNASNYDVVSYEINLLIESPDLPEAELIQLARQAAFNIELDKYCLGCLISQVPYREEE